MPEYTFPPTGKQYDFIFLGMGCATLSLVMRMVRSGQFRSKNFLIIEKEPKLKNDRTWCFWEDKEGFFEPVVYRKWQSIAIITDQSDSELNIAPYEYKMIRGIDFYTYCLNEIRQQENIDIVYARLGDWWFNRLDNRYEFKLNDKLVPVDGLTIFNSVYKAKAEKKNIRLLQHFKGWIVETSGKVFKPAVATIMDFRVPQEKGTTFGYVLPFSESSALIEYTLFSKELLPDEEYELLLKNYLKNILKIEAYTIRETEFGVIPMTNEKFRFVTDAYNIGTAGGQTKASSGYTFQFIQKQSEEIVRRLTSKDLSLSTMPETPKRFRFYDNVLLDILYRNKLPGHKIFTRLFKKNKPQQVLRFLDNESSLREELKIISTLPTWPFLKSGIKQLLS